MLKFVKTLLSVLLLLTLLVACGQDVATEVAPTPVVTLGSLTPPSNVATLPPANPAATQPTQPTSGPGGSTYLYPSFTSQMYNEGAEAYYIYEPSGAVSDQALPVVVFLHGYEGIYPVQYKTWIEHIVRRGNILIFPAYQLRGDRDGTPFTANALNAVRQAVNELSTVGKHWKADFNRLVTIGYSAGGVVATNFVAQAAKAGLPIPKALFAVTPGGCANCSALSIRNFTLASADELGKIDSATKLLVLTGQNDAVVGETAALVLWQGLKQIPVANKNYVHVLTDFHGKPPLVADHGMASRVLPDAFNYYGLWKLFDALQSCALDNKDCQYALGNTAEQRDLGKWSDGVPIVPLKIIE